MNSGLLVLVGQVVIVTAGFWLGWRYFSVDRRGGAPTSSAQAAPSKREPPP